MTPPFDLANVLPPWDPLLETREYRVGERGVELILNPAATDAGRRAGSFPVSPATREALGADSSRTVTACDCPACAPRVRAAPVYRVPLRGDVVKAMSAIAVARAVRFAGLNTPDRKQMGAAQCVHESPNATVHPPLTPAVAAPVRIPPCRAPAHLTKQ